MGSLYPSQILDHFFQTRSHERNDQQDSEDFSMLQLMVWQDLVESRGQVRVFQVRDNGFAPKPLAGPPTDQMLTQEAVLLISHQEDLYIWRVLRLVSRMPSLCAATMLLQYPPSYRNCNSLTAKLMHDISTLCCPQHSMLCRSCPSLRPYKSSLQSLGSLQGVVPLLWPIAHYFTKICLAQYRMVDADCESFRREELYLTTTGTSQVFHKGLAAQGSRSSRKSYKKAKEWASLMAKFEMRKTPKTVSQGWEPRALKRLILRTRREAPKRGFPWIRLPLSCLKPKTHD